MDKCNCKQCMMIRRGIKPIAIATGYFLCSLVNSVLEGPFTMVSWGMCSVVWIIMIIQLFRRRKAERTEEVRRKLLGESGNYMMWTDFTRSKVTFLGGIGGNGNSNIIIGFKSGSTEKYKQQ